MTIFKFKIYELKRVIHVDQVLFGIETFDQVLIKYDTTNRQGFQLSATYIQKSLAEILVGNISLDKILVG